MLLILVFSSFDVYLYFLYTFFDEISFLSFFAILRSSLPCEQSERFEQTQKNAKTRKYEKRCWQIFSDLTIVGKIWAQKTVFHNTE